MGSGAPLERDDPWHLGSNGKALTAILAARLEQDGRVSWDDNVKEVLDDQLEGMHPAWGRVTLAHLLAHCSGLPPGASTFTIVRLVGDDSRDALQDRLRYAQNVLRDPPRSEPGSEMVYSNAGYVVAGSMLEARAGETWEELIQQEVFAPLGLDTPGIGPPGSEEELDSPRGHRHGWFGLGDLQPVAPDFAADNPPALGPAGRVHMSLSDYGAFLVDQLRGSTGEGTLVSAESYGRLQDAGCDPSMASGWAVNPEGDLHHAGSNTMWYAEAKIWQSRGVAMAVTSNDGRVEHQRPSVGAFIEQLGRLLDSEISD